MATIAPLIPIFLLIAIGYLLFRVQFPPGDFWDHAGRLIYYVLFPCLLFTGLIKAPLEGLGVWPMIWALVVAILAVSLVLLATRRLFAIDGPVFSSIFQGGLRMNTYVGLGVAAVLAGEIGTALAAVAIATMVPLLNILCVAVLTRYGHGGDRSLTATLHGIVRNPLILACVLGIAARAAGAGDWLPAWLLELTGLLGRAALPLGLLAVGAGLRLRFRRGDFGAVGLASITRFVVLPGASYALCGAFGASPEATLIAVLFSAIPTAAAAYVLALELGGDHQLMARIISFQTLLAMATLPLTLALVARAG